MYVIYVYLCVCVCVCVYQIFLTFLMHALNHKGFFVLFCFCFCFCFCFSFIALARTSSTMLIRSVESRHTCLVPDLREKSFQSFTIKYDICCGVFVDALYQTEGLLFILFGVFLIMKGCWHLSNACFGVYWDDHMVLCFILLI